MKTHDGKTVSAADLVRSRKAVAEWTRKNAIAIREEDDYAAHVSESSKNRFMLNQLNRASKIEKGTAVMSFCLWQRLNTFLTGECIPFLPYSRIETK